MPYLKDAKTSANDICTKIGADGYIAYITSTREPANAFGGIVAPDALIHFAAQLKKMGKKDKLVLLLNTNGGDLNAPWPIVSILREYCNELHVVVVSRALSAGTLMSMAADKIYMNPDTFLSPVDPQTTLMINGAPKSVGVEDVTGYIEFVKNKVGLSGGAGMEKAFESLTTEIVPSTIGSLYRTHALIRSLASKMLSTRKKLFDSTTEKQIVENLTEKLFSHSHLISRSEAKNSVGFGATIVYPQDDLSEEIDKFTAAINKDLKVEEFFDPLKLLSGTAQYEEEAVRAVVFTGTDSASFKSKITLTNTPLLPPGTQIPPGMQVPPGTQGNINVNDIGWVKS